MSKTIIAVVGAGGKTTYIKKKAKEYLALKKSTKQTTTEIIYKCGFNSTATFYRALKGLRSKNINI